MNCIKYEKNVRKIKSMSKSKRFDCYDAKLDANAIENGLLASEEDWNFEKANMDKSEDVFIYGVDSNENVFVLKFKRRPTKDGKCWLSANLQFKDGEEIYEFDDSEMVNKQRSMAYCLHGLHIQVLSPLRKIRITFRGILRKRSVTSKQFNEVFAKINLFWYPLSKVFDFKCDHKASFVAVDLTLNEFDIETAFDDRYEQYGQLKGTIEIESNSPKFIYLWGNKCKQFYDEDSLVQRSWKRIFAFSKEGLAFHFGVCIDKLLKKGYRYGHCITGFLTPFPIANTALSLNESLKINQITEFLLSTKDDRTFIVKLDEWNETIISNWCTLKLCSINGNDGGCIIVDEGCDENLDKIVPPFFTKIILLESKTNCDSLVVPLEKYYFSDVCGGKAASLSHLMFVSQEIAENIDIPYFVIPKGIIVTTNAYRLFIDENVDIADIIDSFESNIWKKTYENVRNGCEVTTRIIQEIDLSSETKNEIKALLEEMFGDELESKTFAVRSSQIDEDSNDMSAAGIYGTQLGVKGLQSVYKAVVNCWASQFSYKAVEYKLNFGQSIHNEMAVIIQEMVNSDVSGVLFTCNPVSGDPRRVIISANYGLCESVVSCKSEPDKITVFTTVDAVPKIEEIEIGSKKLTVKLPAFESQGTGTVTLETDPEDAKKCCLDDDLLVQLTILAVFLRKTFGHEVDVEWAIKDNAIYLFQLRPVTNLDNYTEWDVFHEMDSGSFTETAVLSRESTCESFPSSMSPFGLSFFRAVHNVSLMITLSAIAGKVCEQVSCPYISLSVASVFNQLFIDVKSFMMFNFGDQANKKAHNISNFGHDIQDDDVNNYCNRGAQIDSTSFKNFVANVGCSVVIVTAGPMFHRTKQKFKRFDMLSSSENYLSSKSLFEFILNSMSTIFEVHKTDTYCSNAKTAASIALITTLLKADESNLHLDQDMSLILTHQKDVISGDVTTLLREIAVLIENRAKFRDLSDKDAFTHLMHNEPLAKKAMQKFFKKHGHRCFNEFDIYSEPWEKDATVIIKIIRKLFDEKSVTGSKQHRPIDEILGDMQTALPQSQKFLLKQMLIPLLQKSIKIQEQSRSFLTFIYNEYRHAFHKLSELMVNEGRIPEKEILFFLTIEEIHSILMNRNAAIVSKAKQRMKLFPIMKTVRFENVIKGPEFLPKNCTEITNGVLKGDKVCGTPVCVGKVSSRAVVVNSYDEIDLIQRGDILITNSVDVCWTPCFSLISGVVTELDNLLSHGAIVVREYGLPCIVGAKHATTLFKTGDHLLLDSQNGVLMKAHH